MNGRARHQGGWVATFVIVGAVLVLGLLGSVWYVKSHHDNATKSEPAPSSSSDKQSTDSSDKKAPAGHSSSKPTSKPRSTDTTKKSDTSSTPQNTSSSTPGSSSTQPLPHTGPTETVSSLVVLGLLAFIGVSYARSRRFVR